MTRRTRIVLISAAIPVVLLAVLWAALLMLGNTQWGHTRLEALVGQLTRNQVRLIGLGGDLPDHLVLRELQLSDAQGIWLDAWNLDVVWHPWALLDRHIAVQSGHAQRIDWSRLPVATSHSTKKASIPDIDVHEVNVDTVNLSAALAGTAATVNLHGSAHLRSLEDMQLAIAATRLDNAGTYSVQLAFNKARMDGAFRLREPDHGPLAGLLGVPGIGTVQVSGDLAGLREAEKISLQAELGELHAQVKGDVDLLHRSANLDYAADATAMAPRPDLSWQQLHVRGTWHGTLASAVAIGELDLKGMALPGAIAIASLDATLKANAGDVKASGRLGGLTAPGVPSTLFATAPLAVDGAINFAVPTRPFQLRASHPAFSVQAKGQAAKDQTLEADAEIPNVAALLQALPGGFSGPLRVRASAQRGKTEVALRVNATGNLDSSLASVHAWMRGPESADLRATYGASGLSLGESVIANQAWNLTASGKLSAQKQGPATLSAKSRLTLADLSLVLPSLSGQATVHADLSGTTAMLSMSGDLQAALAVHGSSTGTVRGTFEATDVPRAPQAQLRLKGSLAGQPLNLQAEVQVRPGVGLHINLPHADWQSAHAQGDLMFAQDLDRSQGTMKWSVANLGDLNELLGQHLAGALNGALILVPPTRSGGMANTRLQVSGQAVQIGTQKFDATLTGTGPLHALQLDLAAQAQLLGKPAVLKAQGHLDTQQKNLTLSAATATVHAVDLKLQQAAVLDFAHGLAIGNLHLSAADAQLQAAGQISPQLQLNAELTAATPGLIDAILPGYLASGSFNASATLQGTLARPVGQVKFSGKDLRAPGDAGTLPPVQLTASAELTPDGARLQLRSSAGDATRMAVDGNIPWAAPIAVTASGNLDLARLNPLLESGGRRIGGTIDVNASIAGTLDAPTVKGTVQLRKGNVHDYRHGIDLTDIDGALEGTQNELRITQLTAHAAAGTVSVTGTLGVLQGGWPVDLKFTAKDATPFASSIVTGIINADLTLKGTALHEMTLAGNVHINRATIEIPNSFPPNVAVLEVRRPGQLVTPPSSGPVFILDVAVNAPRQILVRGRGLEAELGGRIHVGGTASTPTIDGGFDLQRGLFSLASTRLNFSSGRVSFTGQDVTGKIDPTLDFTAQTTALDATVTMRITGVADAPQFELTSIPLLPQDEILARLLFGESAQSLSALQYAQIGAALVTLTGAGSGLNPLVELQKHLGLDRLAVGSNDTGTPGGPQTGGATIEAGRYVTNRIFLDVKQNTTGATQLQVDVDLTSKLKLQTRLGTGTATAQGTTPDNDPGSSLGLSYRFEY